MKKVLGAAIAALALAGCGDAGMPSEASAPLSAAKAAPAGSPSDRAAALAARVNARLEKAGSQIRVDEAWFFTTGFGTDPYRRLRTGSRWTNPEVSYTIIESRLTTDAPAAEVRGAVERGYEVWNTVGNTTFHISQIAPPAGMDNIDVLDGIVRDNDGVCIDVLDADSDIYDAATDEINPVTHNVFGGWLAPEYFKDCLGSENIIGVTWTFSYPDGALGQGTDGYRDRAYTEMFYNTAFKWTTTDAVYLDFDAPTDIETIVAHEAGHAHGLGHFGGPNTRQPFKLQPNGRVFDPEAVMNPFYIGGEKRSPLPTDVSALRTMYATQGGN
jgi:hypothetical protein